MPGLDLRLGFDVIGIDGPLESVLERMDFGDTTSAEIALMEPETLEEAHSAFYNSGVHIMSTHTRELSRAHMAHVGLVENFEQANRQAFDAVKNLKPQHIVAVVDAGATNEEGWENACEQARLLVAMEPDALALVGINQLDTAEELIAKLVCETQVPLFALGTFTQEGTLVGDGAPAATFAACATEAGARAVGIYGGGLRPEEVAHILPNMAGDARVLIAQPDVRGYKNDVTRWSEMLVASGATIVGAADGSTPALAGGCQAMVGGSLESLRALGVIC